MKRISVQRLVRVGCVAACCASSAMAFGSVYRGQVMYGGQPVPGATVTATQGAKTVVVTSDATGAYVFPDLADGAWTIKVEMLCFATSEQAVTVAAATPACSRELKLLPMAEILAKSMKPEVVAAPVLTARTPADAGKVPDAPKPGAPPPPPPSASAAANSSDGFLINGSVSNASTSQFSLAAAFGNTRSGRNLYSGGIGLQVDNSAFDAKPYSLTGLDTPKPGYNRDTLTLTFGGPLNLPHVMPHGPTFFIVYQGTRNRTDTTLSGLVPTEDERAGLLPSGTVPVSAQSAALLTLYPLPNLVGSTAYNYQTAAISNTHEDALQLRLDRSVGNRDTLFGTLATDDSRADAANLFRFVDTTDTLGLESNVNW